MTPNSGSSPYLSVNDFLSFQDVNLVGQLVRDDKTIATATELQTDANLAAALGAASGEVESACLRGERYSVADLQSLNGNSLLLLKRLISAIAMMALWDRRDGPDPPANVVRKFEWAEKYLERLENGDQIFAFAEVEEAGLPESQQFSNADLISANLITAGWFRPMFGNRASTKTPPLGF